LTFDLKNGNVSKYANMNNELEVVFTAMDLINRVMIPNVIIVIASGLEMNSFHRLRTFQGYFSVRFILANPEWIKKQVRLALNLIILNIICIVI